MNNNRLPS